MSTDLRALEQAMKGAFDKMGGRIKDVESLVLDLAQNRTRVPQMGGSAPSAAIRAAIETNIDAARMDAMKAGQRATLNFSIPHDAFRAAAITSPVVPGDGALQDPDRASGLVGPAQRRLTLRQLLPELGTNAGATSFTQLSAFTSNAQVQGNGVSPDTREGEILGESNMSFTLKTVPVVTIGSWLPASVQILDDQDALEMFIRTWLTYGLQLEEEDELLNGSGGSSHMEGLITAAAIYNRGSTNDTRADTLRRGVTQLALSEHICDAIVLHHHDSEALDLLKDNEGRYLMVTIDGRAWRVPVVSTNSIAVNTWLAMDTRSVLVRPRKEVVIEISNSHSDYFTRLLVAIRAHLREALEIHRPLGLLRGSF